MRMPCRLANGHVWFVKSPRCVVMLTPLCSGGILRRTEASRSIAWMVLPGESRPASATVNVPVPQPRSAHFVGPSASPPLSASISVASRRRTAGSYRTPSSPISAPPWSPRWFDHESRVCPYLSRGRHSLSLRMPFASALQTRCAMHAGFSNCVQGLLLPAIVAATACSSSHPAESPTSPTPLDSPHVTVEAAEVTRESAPFVGCPAGTPFRLRVVVLVSADQDVSI